jgi:2-dehydro-3-deoxyphosphogluconate aldolase/(4S)-4-hydroxy-2-oxoglutarate aldolase
MVELGLVPVFYNGDVEVAKRIVSACADGGARVVEFTNRGDQAFIVFTELVRHFAAERPELILGVGSVIDPGTAALYISCGANFVVGPVLNPEMAKVCNRRKVAYSPGCGSASEISEAEELGVEICKVFPGTQVGGPAFVKAVRGPCPWTSIMPTGGVDATWESISGWFKAGVTCVGMGSKLIRKDLVAAGDFDAITRNVTQVLAWIRQARGESLFQGIEHVGLYPYSGADGHEVAEWYHRMFGLELKEGNSSIFVSGPGPGRIEVMKKGETDRCHVAILVSDFDAAVVALKTKGSELEDPNVKPNAKSVYLKETDPAGNRVHLLWRR